MIEEPFFSRAGFSDNRIRYLSGSTVPGTTGNAAEDTAPVGSLYLRTNGDIFIRDVSGWHRLSTEAEYQANADAITALQTAISGKANSSHTHSATEITDLDYTHTQMIPSAVWTINHNLGKYASVTVIDSAGSWVQGDVFHNSGNQITITFSSAFAGIAYTV